MTTQILFNQFAYTDRLKRDNAFSDDQARASAEALAAALSETVATSSQLDTLRSELTTDIAALRSELKADISALRSELKTDISDVRTEIATIKTEIATVRTEIAIAKNETLRWVFGFNIGLIAAVFAIAKYIH